MIVLISNFIFYVILVFSRFNLDRFSGLPWSPCISYWVSFTFIGSKRSREVLFHVLSNACEDGDLTIDEALEAVEDIFRQNALRLYNLSAIVGSTDYKSYSIQKSTLKIDTLLEDIMFVRIIWADSSGQQRCRVSLSPIGLSVALLSYICNGLFFFI